MKILLVTVCFSFALAGTSAWSMTGSEQEARRIFKEGVAAFNEGLLSDALASFKKAYALRPSFRILYNIGQVQAELRHYDLALEAFEGYLAQGGDRIDEERRTKVERELEKLLKHVGQVWIKGTKGGEVWIDGERKGFLPLAATIPLTAGSHELIVRRGTMPPCQKAIEVRGGENSEHLCYLEDESETVTPIESAMPLTSHAAFHVDTKPNRRGNFLRDVAPWMTASLGLVTFTTGVICALKTASLNRSLRSTCTSGNCPPNRETDVEKLPRLAATADGMFIATAALSGLSVLLFTAPWDKKKNND